MITTVRVIALLGAAVTFSLASAAPSVAKPDPLIGATYKDALTYVAAIKRSPIIETIAGDQLEVDDCIVTSWQRARRTIGAETGQPVVLLNLNCNDLVASAGTPGNSAASVPGRAAIKAIDAQKKNAKTAAFCSMPEQKDNDNCEKWCSKHDGMCTAAL